MYLIMAVDVDFCFQSIPLCINSCSILVDCGWNKWTVSHSHSMDILQTIVQKNDEHRACRDWPSLALDTALPINLCLFGFFIIYFPICSFHSCLLLLYPQMIPLTSYIYIYIRVEFHWQSEWAHQIHCRDFNGVAGPIPNDGQSCVTIWHRNASGICGIFDLSQGPVEEYIQWTIRYLNTFDWTVRTSKEIECVESMWRKNEKNSVVRSFSLSINFWPSP